MTIYNRKMNRREIINLTEVIVREKVAGRASAPIGDCLMLSISNIQETWGKAPE
jgi:hypothetical protein